MTLSRGARPSRFVLSPPTPRATGGGKSPFPAPRGDRQSPEARTNQTPSAPRCNRGTADSSTHLTRIAPRIGRTELLFPSPVEEKQMLCQILHPARPTHCSHDPQHHSPSSPPCPSHWVLAPLLHAPSCDPHDGSHASHV